MFRWWLLLAAKGIVLLALHIGLLAWAGSFFADTRLGIDLDYTFSVMCADLVLFVVGYFFWMDQKYRCRTCLRRLRMPVAKGSFGKASLFSPPSLEWICTYGHGTLREPSAPLVGPAQTEWVQHKDDFWQAFEDAWRKD
ncbi:MAG: hypothetical protein NW208_17390 [Bryobacter sp.]|nr:hypothetical protein [Bryobacter sp.]